MSVILITLTAVFIVAIALHLYKRNKEAQAVKMADNEYNIAITLWNYARLIKGQIEEAVLRGSGVIDFSKIAVPHSQGYKVSLELIGNTFRVYAVPVKYSKTGRLSFYTDQTLTVRASDHAGERATVQDLEYAGTQGAKSA